MQTVIPPPVARINLATTYEPTLAEVLAYENDAVVARIMHEAQLSYQEAEAVFKDTLRFLWLGHRSETTICPSKHIDAGWHVFLLFTKDYREFCQRFFGHFIDHHPRRPEDAPDGGAMVRKTVELAEVILVPEMGHSLSSNWKYDRLEHSGDCCGNCGSDCCSR